MNLIGVKLAQEIDEPCDIDLPIPDFSIPDPQDCAIALVRAIGMLNRYGTIYVGCMGGYGRTGIFLSLLVRIIGTANEPYTECRDVTSTSRALVQKHEPIEYVRAKYVPQAVETSEQEDFVMNFPIAALVKLVKFL